MKLHIPNDFSVAGFEDSPELKHLSVPVTAMHTPANFPGETAVNALLAMLNNTPSPCRGCFSTVCVPETR